MLSSNGAAGYEVLARRTRPQTFADVVGQEHVTRTLVNAISSGRVAHAFVFNGIRGVGKTTTARILAKALNCERGPTPEPCNQCPPCVEITEGRSLDVIEVDAASQTGIDAARELLETVKYQPASSRYRIYIIDEAHGLSKQAVDAFLKTLEEPPPHAKFILATTAAHRLTATILSRCQRYDFRAVPVETIVGALQRMTESDGRTADPAALRSIARDAGGSLRDATSLLEQVLAFTEGHLDSAAVHAALGLPDVTAVRELVAAAIRRDPARALEVVGGAADQGADLARLAHDVLRRLRDLAVRALAGPAALTDLTDAEIEEITEAGQGVAPADVQRSFRIMLEAYEEIARSQHPRLVLEMAVLQMAALEPLLPLDELVTRLEAIERGEPVPPRGVGMRESTPTARAERSPISHATPPSAPRSAAVRAPEARTESRAEERAPNAATGQSASSEAEAEPGLASAGTRSPEQERWDALVAALQRESASRFFRLSYSRLLELADDEIRIAVAGQDAARALLEEETRAGVERAIAREFGRNLKFVPVVPGNARQGGASGGSEPGALERTARQDPAVQMSVELLEGRVEAVMPRLRREE